MKKTQGFTLFELLISIAILGIISTIAIPNLSEFLIRIRVDNEISQLDRLIASTRNAAVNSGQNVTICPLNTSNTCQNTWTGEITVFIDGNGNGVFEPNAPDNEERIRVKEALTNNDTFLYNNTRITYEPDGTLAGNFQGTFRYCPQDNDEHSRGITISSSTGRTFVSRDTDNDGRDENRTGNDITCESQP